MQECVFCKIIAKEKPADIFYEDEYSISFPNLSPVVNGHVMVVPKIHSENILDINTEDLKNVAASTQIVARKVLEKYNSKAFNLLMANGKDAQQSVFHFHWHLIPRYHEDGLDLWIKQRL